MGGASRLRIRPPLLFAFIPAVIQQSGFWITGVLVDEDELVHDIVVVTGLSGHDRVPGIEWFGHEQSIQPHLIWIDLFMPESPFVRPGLVLQLLPERIGSTLV